MKKYAIFIAILLFSCAIFGQNDIQKQLISTWETTEANGKTYNLTITEKSWNHSRPLSIKKNQGSYKGNYKFKRDNKIIITYKTEFKEVKKYAKIIKLDNQTLVFKLIEKGYIFNIDRTTYSFKKI